MKRKLKNNRGETVVEVLASVLIAVLSVALLFGAVMASGSMDRGAQKTDADFYAGLSEAQAHKGTPAAVDKEVEISIGNPGSIASADVSVYFYGGGGVLSYVPAP